jgi:hypothetical protein
MTTSGTNTFNLSLAEVIEEAYERAGLEARTGYDLLTGTRSLNLLLQEWTNDGVNLWTMDQFSVQMVADQTTYTLDGEWIDVIDCVTNDSSTTPSTDIPNDRITLSAYLNRPNKSTAGRPVNHALERNEASVGHTLYVWPAPDANAASYQLKFWGIRKIQDGGAYSNNIDVPNRALPALISGLAYKIAEKNKRFVSPQDRAELMQNYAIAWSMFKLEDRERASLFIRPNMRRGR